MKYAIYKNSSLNEDHYLSDVSSLDWTNTAVNQSINIGPFSITVDLHLNQQSIIDSYFQIKAVVKIPYIGDVVLVDGRIDKNNSKLEATISHLVGAAIIFDTTKLNLSAHLYAFGYSYDIILWQFQ